MNEFDLDLCCYSCVETILEATDRNDIVNSCEYIDACYELIKMAQVVEK